jgi:carbamoyl-phosphate synthase small subunit
MTTQASEEGTTVRSRAVLALEDGTIFEGQAFGRAGEVTGEVVFNTALCGYQEVLTDPSYAGQIVTMTYPHIGNYGVNRDDVESARPQVSGFVVREVSTVVSSWRASGALDR